MKIGIFGGSFNPIHNGHIKIAKLAYQELNLDILFFVPAAVNPFKKNKFIETNQNRINMIRLAISDCQENFQISEFETNRGGVSYTFETIRFFKQKYPKEQLFFIMGSDLLPKFNKWEHVDEMVQDCQFVCFKRSKNINKINAKKYQIKILANEIISDSSTKIRGGDFSFLNPKVNEYIGKNFLYAKEIIHSILSAKRAKHCVAAGNFAAELAKKMNFDAKRAFYAGLFHDVAKELDEEQSREMISAYKTDGFNKIKYPKYTLHQICGALWLEHIYKISDPEIVHSVEVHTTLALKLSLLDKIVFIADKICDGRAFNGIQKLRKLVFENFDAGFAEVVKRVYEYNLSKGIIFSKEQEDIHQKWMKTRN